MVWQALLPAAVSFATNLATGFLGKDDPEPQVTRNSVDYKKLVRDAQDAGFNPLTALRNGGAAGYSVTNHPVQSSTSNKQIFANALGAGVKTAANVFSTMPTAYDIEKREAEMALVNAQIGELNRRPMKFGGLGAAPSATTSTITKIVKQMSPQLNAPTLAKTATQALGLPTVPEAGESTVTNPFDKMLVDPTVRDAAVFEERYGDVVGGLLGGVYVGVNDAIKNIVPAVRSLPTNFSQFSNWWQQRAKSIEKLHSKLPEIDTSAKPFR